MYIYLIQTYCIQNDINNYYISVYDHRCSAWPMFALCCRLDGSLDGSWGLGGGGMAAEAGGEGLGAGHRQLLQEMRTQNFDMIRFASYRTACKLRFVQKKANREYILFLIYIFLYCDEDFLNDVHYLKYSRVYNSKSNTFYLNEFFLITVLLSVLIL